MKRRGFLQSMLAFCALAAPTVRAAPVVTKPELVVWGETTLYADVPKAWPLAPEMAGPPMDAFEPVPEWQGMDLGADSDRVVVMRRVMTPMGFKTVESREMTGLEFVEFQESGQSWDCVMQVVPSPKRIPNG